LSSSSLPNKKSIPTPPPTKKPTPTPTPPTPTPPPIVKKATPTPTPPATTPPPNQQQQLLQQQQQQQQETTNQLYDMLEKTQRERDNLLLQMKNKETAWERLVSSKESLSLRVEEGESQCQRLSRQLEEAQLEVERLQHGLAERDASIAKNQRDEEKQSQDQRRIERLETLVRELQNQLQTTKDEQALLNREHAGQVEQVRREVTASEAMTASLEKECEELRRAGLEAIHAYEASVIQLNQKHELALQERDQLVQQLQYTVADLKHKQSTLFDDDEQDIETRLDEMKRISNIHQPNSEEADQRHRLEEQLELAMTELEHERLTIQTMAHEMDQFKLELTQARQQTLAIEQKFETLQADFEKELNDKKRLIEEADNAFEAQAKAEDEHYQMKLSKMALEKEFAELVESNKQLEQDFNNLMDEMLVLEKQDLKKGDSKASKGQDSNVLQEKIQQLEKENEKHRHSLSVEKNQVSQLSKDLAELESLVESRVFGEADLEEQLEMERKKVISLERELDSMKNRASSHMKGLVISPTTTSTTAASSPTPSANHKQQYAEADDDLSQYCELCERYGHDVLQCKNELSLTSSGKLVNGPFF
jgi:chromosome segregation ATPase